MFGQLNEFENWCFRPCHWPRTRQQRMHRADTRRVGIKEHTKGSLRHWVWRPEQDKKPEWCGLPQAIADVWCACSGAEVDETSPVRPPKVANPIHPQYHPWEPGGNHGWERLAEGYEATGQEGTIAFILKTLRIQVSRAKVSTSVGHSASRSRLYMFLYQRHGGRQPGPASEIVDWKI